MENIEIEVLDKVGAELLLNQTKTYINKEVENNTNKIVSLSNNYQSFKNDVYSTISHDDIYPNWILPKFNNSFNFFKIGESGKHYLSYFRITKGLHLSLNYPSTLDERSHSAIYIDQDTINLRTLTGDTIACFKDENNVYIGKVLNEPCFKVYQNDVSIRRGNKIIKFNTSVIKLHNNYSILNLNEYDIELKTDSNIILKTDQSKFKIDNNIGTFGFNGALKIYFSESLISRKFESRGFYFKNNSKIGIADLTNSSVLLHNSDGQIYTHQVNTALLTVNTYKNTLYYPKGVKVQYANNGIIEDYYLKIGNVGEHRLAINCKIIPIFDTLYNGKLITKAKTILELNGNEINIGKTIKGNRLNVNYNAVFNNKTTFNYTVITNNNIKLNLRFNSRIEDGFDKTILFQKDVLVNNSHINKLNSYFCTLYRSNNLNSTRLLKITPTVGFLILKNETDDGIHPGKAVEYNLKSDTFSVKTNFINLQSSDLVNVGNISLKSTDGNSKLRITSDNIKIKQGNKYIDIINNVLELKDYSDPFHKILLLSDDINIQSKRDIYLNSELNVKASAKRNTFSGYRPVFELSPDRVHLDDFYGTAMLDNQKVNTSISSANNDTFPLGEVYLNYPEIVPQMEGYSYVTNDFNTKHALKLQRVPHFNGTNLDGEESTLTLNGDNIYLDGFKTDATLNSILSSKFGPCFEATDNGYKCNLLKLIKEILVSLISK